ncbi:hypothetical protein LSAT2_023270 [Lamellibrachia satsuma]|nr:hypothetical protein LSAT2_023270 [Lamellibrachia satsuma]
MTKLIEEDRSSECLRVPFSLLIVILVVSCRAVVDHRPKRWRSIVILRTTNRFGSTFWMRRIKAEAK